MKKDSANGVWDRSLGDSPGHVRPHSGLAFGKFFTFILCLIGLFLGAPGSAIAQTVPLGPGNHTRTLMMGYLQRSYLIHIPKGHNLKLPTPVILALLGAAMNAQLMEEFCGLDETADKEGFIVVYPNGTGAGDLLIWNAGGLQGLLAEGDTDDVAFIDQLLKRILSLVRSSAPTRVR